MGEFDESGMIVVMNCVNLRQYVSSEMTKQPKMDDALRLQGQSAKQKKKTCGRRRWRGEVGGHRRVRRERVNVRPLWFFLGFGKPV